MGHFSKACAVSDVAITGGDRCGVLLLRPNVGFDEYLGPYLIACPPVWGVYDDYGRLEDLEPSVGASVLERLTGDAAGALGDLLDPREESAVHKSLVGFRVAWVRRDSWDLVKEPLKSDVGRIDVGHVGFLLDVGAKFVRRTDGRYRYEFSLGRKTVRSDGTWIDGSVYSVRDFERKFGADCSRHRRWTKSDLWRVGFDLSEIGTDELSGARRRACRQTDPFVSLAFVDSHTTSSWVMDAMMGEEIGSHDDLEVRRLTAPFRDLWGRLRDDEVCGALADCGRVVLNIRSMSKRILPSDLYATPQDGDHEGHLELMGRFRTVLMDIKKKQREYDEE